MSFFVINKYLKKAHKMQDFTVNIDGFITLIIIQNLSSDVLSLKAMKAALMKETKH